MASVRSITILVFAIAFSFGLGWQFRPHLDGRSSPNVSSNLSEQSHPIGAVVNVPSGFDTNWISSGYMTHSGVGRVSILKIAIASTPRSILVANGPKSYEVDVLARVCANHSGFQAATGSHSADIADIVAINLHLIPFVQRGIDEYYFGRLQLSEAGTPPSLVHERPLTQAPRMKPFQCFTGVVTFAVPVEIGRPGNKTRYSVALTSESLIPGTVQSIWWSQTS
jgi:hypothetical protein